MNEEQLLTQAQQLNPAALSALHQRFYEPVARYIQFKVGDRQTVEDLSGEVFVRVLEGLKRGRGWQGSPQGWIMGIARHVVADHYRHRERMPEVTLNEQITATDEATNPFLQAFKGEQKRRLMAAIQQLTDEQRDVVLMRFMEGIDIRGVATAMNKKPGAIKGLQYRALKALAEIMQDYQHDPTKTYGGAQ
ncbi:MAG: sigma-70 family RNA polymerase sigma factor [Anaerolineae bacterium]|nr:sigma-70 family RNA polymerase sigma factor [Anaerolineae bacterium]